MRILNLNRKLKSARCLPEIVSVFARHGFGHIISQLLERGRTTRFRFKGLLARKAMKLNPDFDILEFSQPYIAQFLVQNFGTKRWERQFADPMEDFTELARDMPLQLRRISQKLQRGSLKFELEHLSLEAMIKAFDRVINRIAFSLIIASLIVGSSIILQGVALWEWKFFLGIMGYLTATFFGFGLVISILRSGRF